MTAPPVLTVNTGSSSLKVALYAGERLVLAAEASGIGEGGRWRLEVDGRAHEEAATLPDHRAALARLSGLVSEQQIEPAAAGHRIVHGGPRHRVPERLTPALLGELERLVAFAPDHLPQAIAAIRELETRFGPLPQVACFDTGFHRHMSAVAQRYALPRALTDQGLARYGFHGLSYESIMAQLELLAPTLVRSRLLVAHLGHGSSMVAVKDGAALDTTMGFSPAGGLVMATRPGDLDPGVCTYLLDQGFAPSALAELFARESGMLAVSETTGDVRTLLAREATDPRAAEALELFCYQATKCAGALAAVLGGLDALIFTGGIGEHAPSIRARITAGLSFLGARLDPFRNAAALAGTLISPPDSVAVWVMRTDENRMIARHTAALLAMKGSAP